MTFTPEFAPDAKSQWLELDVDLQEKVLDEIEQMILDASSATLPEIYRDAVFSRETLRHYLFVHAIVNQEQQRVTILGIALVSRPLTS